MQPLLVLNFTYAAAEIDNNDFITTTKHRVYRNPKTLGYLTKVQPIIDRGVDPSLTMGGPSPFLPSS